jgi:hypothetical protein
MPTERLLNRLRTVSEAMLHHEDDPGFFLKHGLMEMARLELELELELASEERKVMTVAELLEALERAYAHNPEVSAWLGEQKTRLIATESSLPAA